MGSKRTSKASYKHHKYSGARKNLKRVRAALKRSHGGDDVSREEVWRKKRRKDDDDTENLGTANKKVVHHMEAQPTDQHVATTSNMEASETTEKKKVSSSSSFRNINKKVVHMQVQQTDPHVASTSNVEDSSSRSCQEKQISQSLPEQEKSIKPGNVNINWLVPDLAQIESNKLIVEEDKNDYMSGLSGHRIVDIKHVLKWAFDLEMHRTKCQNSMIEFVEEQRNGFNSLYLFKCTMCNKQFRKSNEKDGNEENLNKSFVWGTVTSGSYYTQAAHISNIMDIPTMSANKFRQTEKLLGKFWEDQLTEEISIVVKEEKA